MKVFELVDKQFSPNRLTHSAQDLAAVLNHNCQQIIQAMRKAKTPLLRGVGKAKGPAFVSNIRPDRKTVDVNNQFHQILHTAYLKNGLTATRKNSIFCTTDIEEAYGWGIASLVFPLDGWSGTVFENITDSLSYDKVIALQEKWWSNADFSDSPSKKGMKMIVDGVKKWGPIKVTPSNMANVLENWYEIIITGKSYIGLTLQKGEDAEYIGKVLSILNLDFPDLVHEFAPLP